MTSVPQTPWHAPLGHAIGCTLTVPRTCVKLLKFSVSHHTILYVVMPQQPMVRATPKSQIIRCRFHLRLSSAVNKTIYPFSVTSLILPTNCTIVSIYEIPDKTLALGQFEWHIPATGVLMEVNAIRSSYILRNNLRSLSAQIRPIHLSVLFTCIWCIDSYLTLPVYSTVR